MSKNIFKMILLVKLQFHFGFDKDLKLVIPLLIRRINKDRKLLKY
jgi:hypothetical protein